MRNVKEGNYSIYNYILMFSGQGSMIGTELQTRMTSINVAEEDEEPILNQGTPCLHSSNLVRCTCDDAPLDDAENSPLISYQNHSAGSDRYLADIHCHEAKPIYSNARARRKLLIASIVCLLFVAAEVVGKVFRWNVLCLISSDLCDPLGQVMSFRRYLSQAR